MNLLRFFWLGVFALLIGVASYLAEQLFFPIQIFPTGSIEAQVHEDLKRLRDQNQLPQELSSINEVFVLDERQQKKPINWIKLSELDFPKKSNAKYDLQIEVFDSNESLKNHQKDNFIFFQFSLFDNSSKNKIWELSRHYTSQ